MPEEVYFIWMDPNSMPIALTFLLLHTHTHTRSSSLPSPAPSLSWWCHTHTTPGVLNCYVLNSNPPSWPSRRLCHWLQANLVPDGSSPAAWGSQNPVNRNGRAEWQHECGKSWLKPCMDVYVLLPRQPRESCSELNKAASEDTPCVKSIVRVLLQVSVIFCLRGGGGLDNL